MKQNKIKQAAARLVWSGVLAFFAGCLLHWLLLWIVAGVLVFLSFVPLAIQEAKTARHPDGVNA